LPEISQAISDNNLAVVSVLSGNRNFEGRINSDVKMNYLASPPLCVAYAIAGTMDVDLYSDPLGEDQNGNPVYLRDIWPKEQEVADLIGSSLQSDMFRKSYDDVFKGDTNWHELDVPSGDQFTWAPQSTYVRKPTFFDGMQKELENKEVDISQGRVLIKLGDSVTTDHISPAGAIKRDSPAGQYLIEHGVKPVNFNSYGSRRGNHEVMVRGTFANIRIRNQLTPGEEGGVTIYQLTGEQMSVYEAALRYLKDGVPLFVLAGKEYGSGSSRDWAAKGPALLGVKAVLAESYERIHRSNLIGMGILPLQFLDGQNATSLGLTGTEQYSLTGLHQVGETVTVKADDKEFSAKVRIDTPNEVEYYRHGGILKYVLRRLLK
jgi:aconitate hydratase